MKYLTFALAALLALAGMTPIPASGNVGSEFTYQGRLQDGAQAALGLYDFEFRLFDSAIDGAEIGNSMPVLEDVPVEDGIFSVALDFGSAAFEGQPAWLEIGVRASGSVEPFDLLTPRQSVTPTPYALYALKANIAPGSIGPEQVQSNSFWRMDGNASPPALAVLGTTSNHPLRLTVNSQTGLRLFQAAPTPFGSGVTVSGLALASGSSGSTLCDASPGGVLLGGATSSSAGNLPNSGCGIGVTVSGGIGNAATGPLSTISGGRENTNSGAHSVIAGGEQNSISAPWASIGGGRLNTVTGNFGVVAGGQTNSASSFASVGGGDTNVASGGFSSVPGGRFNTASGGFSFAGGANATASGAGSFAWNSDPIGELAVTKNFAFGIRASGGVGINVGDPANEAALHVRAPNNQFGILIDAGGTAGSQIGLYTTASRTPGLAKNAYLLDGQWQRYSTADGSFGIAMAADGTTTLRSAAPGANPLTWQNNLVLSTNGNVHVAGSLSKGGGTFKIDHPLDPANKYLYHSFVESPDMMNIYNGIVVTDEAGRAEVQMPEWFDALNRDFRYQLTAIGSFARSMIEHEMQDGRFSIRTDEPNVKISWQVTGVRQDAWAELNRFPVEEDKEEQDRGRYLAPEAHGLPASLRIGG